VLSVPEDAEKIYFIQRLRRPRASLLPWIGFLFSRRQQDSGRSHLPHNANSSPWRSPSRPHPKIQTGAMLPAACRSQSHQQRSGRAANKVSRAPCSPPSTGSLEARALRFPQSRQKLLARAAESLGGRGDLISLPVHFPYLDESRFNAQEFRTSLAAR